VTYLIIQWQTNDLNGYFFSKCFYSIEKVTILYCTTNDAYCTHMIYTHTLYTESEIECEIRLKFRRVFLQEWRQRKIYTISSHALNILLCMCVFPHLDRPNFKRIYRSTINT